MFVIRNARDEDINALEELFQITQRATFTTQDPGEFKIGDYARSVEGDKVWVAENNHVIAGFTSIYLSENFLHNLFVHPDYQGLSIGRQLLKIAEDNMQYPMTAKININNLKVCNFYEKHGWHKVGVYGDGDQSYLLTCKTS